MTLESRVESLSTQGLDFAGAILVLDLGNVVFPLEFAEFEDWLATLWSGERAEGLAIFQSLYLNYERNEMDCGAFMSQVRSLMNVDFRDEDFEKKWLSCWRRDTVGMEAALMELKGRLPLVVLSNTNTMHMKHFLRDKAILSHFDRLFFSHELGLSKPQAEIYEEVRSRLGCKSEQLLFFDDKLENIQAARRAGWAAEVFVDVLTMRQRLDQHVQGLVELRSC